ncbi:MAG: DUF4347 domain-containing protein [Cyanobacteria bacterium P01_G01_bin.19]
MNNIESINSAENNSTNLLPYVSEDREINDDLLTSSNQLLFIDSAVENYQILIDNLVESIEVVILDNRQDGVFQITETLKQYDNLDAVHIVSHGNSGELLLGNTVLNRESISKYENELNHWGNAIEEEGDFLLYGCNVALGEDGSHFLEDLSQFTGADILASVDNTGQDGDWELEAEVGEVETTSIFNGDVDVAYQHTLQGTTIGIDVGFDDDFDDGFNDSFDDDFTDQVDDQLFGDDDDDDDDRVDARDFDSFAGVPANNLTNLAERGLNFAEVDPNVLATIDFNNIPAEDFQALRNAGLSLTPLSSATLANINLGVLKNFDYLSQIDLSQTRFNNLTLFGELSTTFAANDNLYDYKAELEINLGLNLDKIVQLSLSDFRAVDYAFEGDEIFDRIHYSGQTSIPAGANPYTDYVERGWREDFDPHPLFDVDYYLSNNTDVRDNGAEPLKHYTTIGFAEANPNRDPHPLFDTSYYNENNTDVVDFNKSPLSHYVENGFKENFDNRDPNRYFDSSYYNAKNPDVIAAG